MTIWSDATMSDFEFKVRRAFFLFAILVPVAGLYITEGVAVIQFKR